MSPTLAPWWNVRSLAGTRGATIFSFTVLFQHTNFRLRAEHLVLVPRVTSPENTLALHPSVERHVNPYPLRDPTVSAIRVLCPPATVLPVALSKREPGPHLYPHLFQSRWNRRARTAPLTQTRFFGTRYTWYHTGFLGQRHIFGSARFSMTKTVRWSKRMFVED